MAHTRFHKLDVFHATQLPMEKVDHLLGTPEEALVVLALMSCTTRPTASPCWHIHFIGTASQFEDTYRTALADHITTYPDSPIAGTEGELRRHLQASRKRRRPLTLLELQERGIDHCAWPLEETDALGLPDLTPLQANPKQNRLELPLDRDFSVQAMVTQGLRIEALQEATGATLARTQTIKRIGPATPLTLHRSKTETTATNNDLIEVEQASLAV